MNDKRNTSGRAVIACCQMWSWAGLGWSKQAPLSGMALKGPGLYLMLCCYHLEILDNIFKKACIFHFALGLDLAGVGGASVKVVDFIFVELGS